MAAFSFMNHFCMFSFCYFVDVCVYFVLYMLYGIFFYPHWVFQVWVNDERVVRELLIFMRMYIWPHKDVENVQFHLLTLILPFFLYFFLLPIPPQTNKRNQNIVSNVLVDVLIKIILFLNRKSCKTFII